MGIITCSCLLLLTLSTAVYASPVSELNTQTTTGLSAFEGEVVNLVNQERAKAGLPALSVSAELTLSAQRYSAYMAQATFFGHQGPDGSTLVSRDTAAGYTGWTYLAENIAAGQSSPRAVVDAWLASPSHRANIFSNQVCETGVGYVTGGSYGHYWTQEFGTRNSAPAAAGAPSSRSNARTSDTLAATVGWTSPQTGHMVSDNWLAFLQAHGGMDNFGYPRTEVIADPMMGGQTVQYYQRAILEWHPEAGCLMRRLLGDIMYPGADPPVSAADAPQGPSTYFPVSSSAPTGLGHFVADFTRTGQPIYFKEYFDSHGGVEAFGYPKEEPKARNGFWTQRFQAAVFEYHPENDKDGYVPGTNIPYRTYRVQLELLGDEYITAKGLPFK